MSKIAKYFDNTFAMWEEFSAIKGYHFRYSHMLATVDRNLTKSQQAYIYLYSNEITQVLVRIYG